MNQPNTPTVPDPAKVLDIDTPGPDADPDFKPLCQVLGPALVADFMYMNTATVIVDKPGCVPFTIHCYKNRTTRNYINISDDVRFWVHVPPTDSGHYDLNDPGTHGSYVSIGLLRALEHPFNNGPFFYPDLVPGRDLYAAIEFAGYAIREAVTADDWVYRRTKSATIDNPFDCLREAHEGLRECSRKIEPLPTVGPVTAFDIAKARGAKEDENGVKAGEFDRVGIPFMGGCQSCQASIAAYNAYPANTGFWRCEDCIRDLGYDSVEAFEQASAESKAAAQRITS